MLPQVQVRREGEDYADQILSKAVKAGRRTYFFDVRATRGDDYFLTITESRKITGPDGSATKYSCTRRTLRNSPKDSTRSSNSSAAPKGFPSRRNDPAPGY